MPPVSTVRVVRPHEIPTFREWAAGEGWNPGRHDVEAFHVADPDGFLVGEVDGEIVAVMSAVAYDGFAFVGHYIVKPAFRDQGHGWKLWQAGMARLAALPVGLDGVMDQVANYERSGFRLSHLHLRYGGTLPTERRPGLVRLADVPFPDVDAYDRACFPAPRTAFLRRWISLPETAAVGVVRGGRLAGFAVARRAVEGHKVGPLFADDAAAAEALLFGLSAEVGGETLFVDVPEAAAHPDAEPLVKRLGMAEAFRCARMYTAAPPPTDRLKVFGVTSLELG